MSKPRLLIVDDSVVIRRALTKHREERIQSAREMAAMLRPAVAHAAHTNTGGVCR